MDDRGLQGRCLGIGLLIGNPGGNYHYGTRTTCEALQIRAQSGCAHPPAVRTPWTTAQLETVLGALDAPPFEAPADVTYGRLRSQLEKAGQSIGANDLLIAAQTLTSGYTLVSDNEREFSRVDDLPLENWIR